MAINVKFTNYDCGASLPCIKVNKPLVRRHKNQEVKFKNGLDSGDAIIKFYDVGDKDGSALEGFCTEFSGVDLPVPHGPKVTCTMAKNPDDYAYTIAAPGSITLDPIIIIEPQKQIIDPSVIIVAVLLLITGFIGFRFGVRNN